jgi:hypothetical protein
MSDMSDVPNGVDMLLNVPAFAVTEFTDPPALEEKASRTDAQRLAVAEREGSESHARMVTVCQCNMLDGGRWNGLKHKQITYDTARHFARFVAKTNVPGDKHPPIAIIGMQELSDADREVIENLLCESTGAAWDSSRTDQGINGHSGIGMFWRTDMVEPAVGGDLGSVIVDQLDNGYLIKFAGRIFRTAAGERFAFFTGKLAWKDAIKDGKPVTGEDRRMEVRRLKSWISEKLGIPPDVAVVASDFNCRPRSGAWREMNMDYTDPSRQHTHTSLAGRLILNLFGKRLDYIWLQRTARAGFADGPHRSPPFGSDHRAVYATIEFCEQP